jgi:hypothetical protein
MLRLTVCKLRLKRMLLFQILRVKSQSKKMMSKIIIGILDRAKNTIAPYNFCFKMQQVFVDLVNIKTY